MTLKNRLFIANVRAVIIAFAAFTFATRMVMLIMHGTWSPDQQIVDKFFESANREIITVIWLLILGFFIIMLSVTNNFFTHRMAKRLIKPLEPLSEGVRQIEAGNLAYRINYRNEDEFRPVCDAFDKMTAKLEESKLAGKKEEANRRELIAGISHDLRTPLTSIKGCVEGIETGVASTPQMREKYLAIIRNKADDMEHIIGQLFLFSKLDMDVFPLNMRRTDLSSAIIDMIDDSGPEYARRRLDIKLTAMPENLYVSADVLMLRNVIINILENSVKYRIKECGSMEISITAENGFVLLRLADNGPGVETEMLSKLFDVFYRTDPSRSKTAGTGAAAAGSGLGLAICAKIIERMGGSIYAEHTAEHTAQQTAGSTEATGLAVVIKLPMLQE